MEWSHRITSLLYFHEEQALDSDKMLVQQEQALLSHAQHIVAGSARFLPSIFIIAICFWLTFKIL